MKKVILISILCIFCKFSFSQSPYLLLQNWKNPKKTEVIKTNDIVGITCFDIIDSVSHASIESYYNGKIISIKPQEIELKIEMESFRSGMNKNYNHKTIYYEISDSLSGILRTNIRNININTISSIHYLNYNSGNIGIGLAMLSVSYAIMAPIFCINYKNGDFNSKFYYNSMAACGIGFCLGLLIEVIFDKSKFVNISRNPPADKYDRNNYKIEIK
jgi:hypothetical protein